MWYSVEVRNIYSENGGYKLNRQNLTNTLKKVLTKVRNDLKRPETTYNDLKRPKTIYNELKASTRAYIIKTTCNYNSLEKWSRFSGIWSFSIPQIDSATRHVICFKSTATTYKSGCLIYSVIYACLSISQ